MIRLGSYPLVDPNAGDRKPSKCLRRLCLLGEHYYLYVLTCVINTPSYVVIQCVCSMCRIEGNQMEDRTMNKMWLVRHLEVTRQLVLEDLRVVRVSETYSVQPIEALYTSQWILVLY